MADGEYYGRVESSDQLDVDTGNETDLVLTGRVTENNGTHRWGTAENLFANGSGFVAGVPGINSEYLSAGDFIGMRAYDSSQPWYQGWVAESTAWHPTNWSEWGEEADCPANSTVRLQPFWLDDQWKVEILEAVYLGRTENDIANTALVIYSETNDALRKYIQTSGGDPVRDTGTNQNAEYTNTTGSAEFMSIALSNTSGTDDNNILSGGKYLIKTDSA